MQKQNKTTKKDNKVKNKKGKREKIKTKTDTHTKHMQQTEQSRLLDLFCIEEFILVTDKTVKVQTFYETLYNIDLLNILVSIVRVCYKECHVINN